MDNEQSAAGERDESFVERSFCIERLRDDKTQEQAYRVSLSSEAPVVDWPWAPPNVLVHEKSSVDLDGIAERGLPFFVNHQDRSLASMVGRIVNVRLERKRLVGEIKFSKANPEAELVRGMVDEGTLTDISIRAEPLKVQRMESGDGKVESVKWLRWRPIEASVVGIGADRSVGIGRANKTISETPAVPAKPKEPKMADEKAAAGTSADDESAEVRVELARQALDKNFAADNEKRRQTAIRNLAKTNGIGDDTVEAWITRGSSLDQVADDMLKIFEERGKKSPTSISSLGLSTRDTSQYSLCRAILAAHTGDWRNAGHELECHNAIAARTDKPQEKGHFYVPLEVQRRRQPVDVAALAERHQLGYLQRDLTAGIAGAGGFLVGTSIASFDELLRSISFAFRMGATRLTGLRDNITIPRQSAAATAEWLTTEASGPSESQPTFVQLAMSPKTVGAYTELSRKLLLQSSIDVEGLVNADLAAVAALAVDSATIRGSGTSGQPMGIDNVTGVGTVSGTSLGLAGLLETQTDLAAANVMPLRGGYVTTPAVAALMIAEVLYANTASPAWVGNVWNGSILGFPAMSTNQVAAATMYFGDWSKLVVGEWGVLEIDTNPYASFAAGIIGVRALYSVDVGVRLPAAFTIASSIT
jgi:HK97 family phage major capsid protein